MVARIGSGASSYIIILSDIAMPTLPMAVFSVLSIIAGVCVFFLPETRDQPLPDTLQVSATRTAKSILDITQDAVILLKGEKGARCGFHFGWTNRNETQDTVTTPSHTPAERQFSTVSNNDNRPVTPAADIVINKSSSDRLRQDSAPKVRYLVLDELATIEQQ